MSTIMDEQYLTVKEIAARFRISLNTAYRLIYNGKLEPVRLGRALRIPLSQVRELEGKSNDQSDD